MTLVDLTTYFITIVAIALAPGPVALMLLVRAASNDTKGALGFAGGFALGGLVIIALVCIGLSTWLTAFPEVLEYSKFALMAYILWVAYGIWKSGFDMSGESDLCKSRVLPSMGAGLTTCFVSPYMMILFPLVLPGVLDIATIEMPGFLIVSTATFAALFTGSVIIIGFAVQLRKLARSPRAALAVNRVLSTVLVFGGGLLAFG